MSSGRIAPGFSRRYTSSPTVMPLPGLAAGLSRSLALPDVGTCYAVLVFSAGTVAIATSRVHDR
jgi:hypothetical protein